LGHSTKLLQISEGLVGQVIEPVYPVGAVFSPEVEQSIFYPSTMIVNFDSEHSYL